MKVEIEINYVEDGRIFINYWDFKHGKDVCVEVKEGKLYSTITGNQVSLRYFLTTIRRRA